MHSSVRYIMGVKILPRYPRLEGIRGETSLERYIKKDFSEEIRKKGEGRIISLLLGREGGSHKVALHGI